MVDLVRRFLSREEGIEGMTPAGIAAFSEMLAYLEELSNKRRSYRGPIEIPLDVFLRTELLGGRLDDEQIAQHMLLLLIGAVETFPKVLGTSILRLYEHPDQRAELIADPSLIPGAFRECLRYDMPTQFLMRVVKKDLEIRGKPLREGQAVMFLYPSGNRDDREFENPNVFDIHRVSRRILTFGHGTHRCLGNHIAEMEGRILLEEILRRMPDYEVDLPNAVLGRTEFLRGYERLPIRF
jgi:cytochrome P450